MDFIMYPPGEPEAERYFFPLSISSPEPGDYLFRLANNTSFFVPADVYVQVSTGVSGQATAPWEAIGSTWLNAESLHAHFAAGNRSWKYVEVLSLAVSVSVTDTSVSGTIAEPTEVSYEIQQRTVVAINSVEIVTDETALNPVTVPTLPAGSFPVNCQCVLTNSPCGEHLAAVLTPPGVAP